MKILVFCTIFVFGTLLAIPAMAEKIEMTDMELAGISAQGWGPGVDIASDMTTEMLSALTETPELFTNYLTQDQHGVELNIAPTTITIEFITSDTQFGAFFIGNLTMKITARVTVIR
ncbi:MAG: hypothetical protein JEZ02_12230 [Desulfatibacillum sp.]|nr:hypothetical protein [Desulfatibacillum sp.]